RLKGRIDSTFNVMKELFKLSPLGSFNFIPDSMTKDLIDSDEFKESTKDTKGVSRKLFSQTAIGSLFDMFDPMKTNSKRSWLGGIFSKFFDSLTSIGSASFSSSGMNNEGTISSGSVEGSSEVASYYLDNFRVTSGFGGRKS